jgi:flavin reductase (DIM6/NTAB) family NADH-FMN oxidoreductase RutF
VNFGNTIRQLLLGTALPQEYLCVEEGLDSPLSVFLTGRDTYRQNISQCHLFLGYRPLIMAVVFKKVSADAEWTSHQDQVCFSFGQRNFTLNGRWNGLNTDQCSVARLMLKKIHTLELKETKVFVFQGESGEHQFLSRFHQGANRLKEDLKKKRPGNVDLPGNLLDQVITAYSIPRVISVITVWNDRKMNLFPTDLHGKTGNFYMSSLRIGGNANEQVERAGTIAISRVDVKAFRDVYEAGKNHMAEPAPTQMFRLSPVQSKQTDIPLPEAVLSYRELRRTGSFDIGIHRIHSYEIISEEMLTPGTGLAHIHRYYAQWRLNHHLPTDMLLR